MMGRMARPEGVCEVRGFKHMVWLAVPEHSLKVKENPAGLASTPPLSENLIERKT